MVAPRVAGFEWATTLYARGGHPDANREQAGDRVGRRLPPPVLERDHSVGAVPEHDRDADEARQGARRGPPALAGGVGLSRRRDSSESSTGPPARREAAVSQSAR